MGNEQPVKYVLLVRHASRTVSWDLPDEYHSMKCWSESAYEALRKTPVTNVSGSCDSLALDSTCTTISDFKTSGFNRTVSIAGYLAELLQKRLECDSVSIFHGCHLVTQQTAKIYQRVLARRKLLKEDDPEAVKAAEWLDPETNDALTLGQVDEIKKKGGTEAVILIGHQPALTRIAHHVLKPGKLPANTLPLGSSEVACIDITNTPRLRWMLTERTDDDLKELKKKIQSKYDVAKFFLGAFVVNTGLILSSNLWGVELWSNRLMAYLAVLFSGIALVLTAATLFSYDELLMPSAFWGEAETSGGGRWTRFRRRLGGPKNPEWNVERPPCQEHVVIFYEMVHIWQYFFTRAILAAFASVGFVVLAIAYRQPILLPDMWLLPDRNQIALEGIILLTLALAMVVYLFWKYQQNRPKLGISD